MNSENTPIRYSVITEKNPREIVMLRGSGCRYRKCRFCNYHLDYSNNEMENYRLNTSVLGHVTGQFGRLEVINSGSFCDLDTQTMELIERICMKYHIHFLHFESHWIHREETRYLRQRFKESGITVVIKTGVETFDTVFRETVFLKGIDTDRPVDIAAYFDEVCLLQGVQGQTAEMMKDDIAIGLNHFKRVCINIMVENGMPVKPDHRVTDIFLKEIYPLYRDNPRVDILLNNTDYGVGGDEKNNII